MEKCRTNRPTKNKSGAEWYKEKNEANQKVPLNSLIPKFTFSICDDFK